MWVVLYSHFKGISILFFIVVAAAYIPKKLYRRTYKTEAVSKILKPDLWLLKEIRGGEIHWGVEMDKSHYCV